MNATMRIWVLCLLFSLITFAAAASDLPVLPRDAHAEWHAVGRINSAGYRKREMCTGTLIATDIVLTAAHCVARPAGPAEASDFTFVAGWLQGEAVDAVKVASIWVHPNAYASGKLDLRFDIALVTLERDSTVLPLPLELGATTSPYGLLGYSVTRPHMLGAAFDCNGAPISSVLQLDCAVMPGNSGGPVLTRVDGGWAVTAVISAMGKAGTIAVPVSRLPSN